MTCASFSRARRGKADYSGWPPPLRDDTPSGIYGLLGLNAADRNRVRIGNLLADTVCKFIDLCIEFKVPIVIENPLTSRLWLYPPFASRMQSGCQLVVFDHCQFGSEYRKPTQLACWNVDLSHLARRCCPREGSCDQTCKPHVILSGASKGEFKTSWGSPYPLGFATAIADWVCGLPA